MITCVMMSNQMHVHSRASANWTGTIPSLVVGLVHAQIVSGYEAADTVLVAMCLLINASPLPMGDACCRTRTHVLSVQQDGNSWRGRVPHGPVSGVPAQVGRGPW